MKETYKIICKKCQAFSLVSKESSEKFEADPESFHCGVCYTKPGEHRVGMVYHHCAKCKQTFRKNGHCACPPSSKERGVMNLTMVMDPNNVWTNKEKRSRKVDEKSEMVKSQLEFNKIVRNRKVEAEQRSIRTDENLQKLVKLLTKQEAKKYAV